MGKGEGRTGEVGKDEIEKDAKERLISIFLYTNPFQIQLLKY